jgi:adenylate cyclase
MADKPAGRRTSGSMFLQETEATVLMFDLQGFSALAAQLGPVDLGAALSRFYDHVESCVVPHDGRVVKFLGDAVLTVWLSSEVEDHRRKAVAALWQAVKKRAEWVKEGVERGVPILDYNVGVATGPVLAGHLGTQSLKFFDILGEVVVVAGKLTHIAAARSSDHLLTGETLESPAGRLTAVEVEGVELSGKRYRLFRLE